MAENPLGSAPIGMFDSGLGGLTVFKALKARLPHENFIYLGDTARLPYGEKSPETILRYSLDNAIFLMDYQIKLLVMACNTAASVSLHKLRSVFKIPVIDVIEPGAEKAAQITRQGRIGVLATKATIASGAYQRKLLELDPHFQVTALACPLLVPLVEEGMRTHPATRLILEDYLRPIKEARVDTLLLGCTHYPLLISLIQEMLGKEVSIVDSASTCAEKTVQVLQQQGCASPISTQMPNDRFFVSDNPEKFRNLACHFLGKELPEILLTNK